MNTPRTAHETESVIRARMAASRVALLDASIQRKRTKPARPANTLIANVLSALNDAPRVRLALLLSAGGLMLGARWTIDRLQSRRTPQRSRAR